MKSTESFDVVIVGAGPAGLKCAEILGGSDLTVLIVEKNFDIGPKVCAGGLTGKDIEYLKLPEELIEFKYNKINLHVNDVCSIIKSSEYFAYTIDRESLGKWQLEKLKRFDNVEIRKSARVSSIEKEYITINDKKISYKFLVGADGSSSVVRNFLNMKSRKMDIAIQYIIPTDRFRDFEVFFDSKLFSSWYSWIFPHQNYVSIGCGCNPDILSSKELMGNFNKWIGSKNIDISNGRYEAFMINYDYQGHQFGNVFLVGDAGGFASGFTGEGIYQAVITGEEVAKNILNPEYKSHKINELLKTKRRHNRLMNFLIRCGKSRTFFFYLGILLLKIPYLKKKALEVLA
ncbi:MAG: NAD(P)/FAD-dependent oxidoreductase [Candidatus Moranbacteria bacterium]|nr:NAD(P)/FAD-dependent oxidoreductase [Candidatus Moranbacteria bacterium]